jgi:dihydrofolate synthase/folylpolyglutamate synthase
MVLEGMGRAPDPLRTQESLERLELPARVEHFPGAPPVVLDGAHTPESFTNLRDTLEEIHFPRPRTVVFSIASDKRVVPVLETLLEMGDRFLLTRADAARSVDPGELRTRLGAGEVVESSSDAVRQALAGGSAVVVCGSIYLAGQARPLLRARARPVATPLHLR